MLRMTSVMAVLTLILAASVATVGAEEIVWLQSIDQARQLAGQTNRLVLVHFWANDCQPCLRMEQTVFNQPGTAQRIQARFVPVKVNAQQFPAVAKQYDVNSWPSDVILAPNGKVVASLRCSQEQAAYLAGLEQVAATADPRMNNAYANLGTQPIATPQPGQTAPVTAPIGNVEDRYADYFRERQQTPQRASVVQPPAAPQQPPMAQIPGVSQIPQSNGRQAASPAPAPVSQNPYAALAAGQPPAVTAPAPMGSQFVGSPPSVSVPPTAGTPAAAPAAATAPLALEGNCPVELVEHERWVKGDRRYGAIHRGQTYLFIGPDQQKRFLASPDHYGPAMSGIDPVLALEARQMVPGLRKHGLFYNNRVYLFSSEATLAQFSRSPARYADGVRFAEAANGIKTR